MWWSQGKLIRQKYEFSSRNRWLIHPEFQIRHAIVLILACAVPALALVGLGTYFIYQNYSVFMEIAYRYSPDLLEHLEREQSFLLYFALVASLVLTGFTFLFSLRTSFRLIGPLYALENHLKRLIRGDLSQPDLKVREKDEYQELIDTYNYYYNSLQRQSEWELSQLKQLKLSPYAEDSKSRWRALTEYKAEQIGFDFDGSEIKSVTDQNSTAEVNQVS
ncbi:MAG: hypothetical protein AB8E15_10910 [Bdellovibrionales bacterium]